MQTNQQLLPPFRAEYITDNYFECSYDGLSVVIDLESGYFNASKLCTSNNRIISNWYKNHKSKLLLKKYNILKIRFGYASILGHYVHQDLFINIALWISTDIYFKCCNFVTKFTEYKYQLSKDNYYISIIEQQNNKIQKINSRLSYILKQISQKKIYNDPREFLQQNL